MIDTFHRRLSESLQSDELRIEQGSLPSGVEPIDVAHMQ